MSKVTVARALTANIANRIVRLATVIAVAVFVVLFALTWALAHFFSAWWWLLLLPFAILLGIVILIRLIVGFVVGLIHRQRMTKLQRTAMDEFTDKVQALLEARATPLPIIVAISIKDLVLHKDVTTIKKMISDTTSLRSDYTNLERLF